MFKYPHLTQVLCQVKAPYLGVFIKVDKCTD